MGRTKQMQMTMRRAHMLIVITEYIMAHGRFPTIRYLNKACGYNSTSAVDFQLNRLVETGYLEKDKGRWHPYKLVGVNITPPGWYYGLKATYLDLTSTRNDLEWDDAPEEVQQCFT